MTPKGTEASKGHYLAGRPSLWGKLALALWQGTVAAKGVAVRQGLRLFGPFQRHGWAPEHHEVQAGVK